MSSVETIFTGRASEGESPTGVTFLKYGPEIKASDSTLIEMHPDRPAFISKIASFISRKSPPLSHTDYFNQQMNDVMKRNNGAQVEALEVASITNQV
ncbi:MAG: hypothetical protein Q7T54_04345 [Candidatus Levybacteria bacterium]|nr:hypothetical protein [Candidatus Levybacteria bacterium]